MNIMILRYNRQVMLPEVGDAGQTKIKSQSSSYWRWRFGLYLQYLATAGVGTIGMLILILSKFTICTDRFYILKIK
jgi:molybdopterin/thiamine biosynthesis adenylyltransferase